MTRGRGKRDGDDGDGDGDQLYQLAAILILCKEEKHEVVEGAHAFGVFSLVKKQPG